MLGLAIVRHAEHFYFLSSARLVARSLRPASEDYLRNVYSGLPSFDKTQLARNDFFN